jgi:hypothetical protein
MGPGIFAAILGGFIGRWAFMTPQFALLPVTPGQQISLLMYLFACLLIIWGANHYRKLLKHLEDEESFRKLTVGELGPASTTANPRKHHF